MTSPVVYLDYHAHTPMDPAVRKVLAAAWREADVNVHAVSQASETVRLQVEKARAEVASLLDAGPPDVVFTSGATEANNLAILGLAEHMRRSGRRQLVVSAGEHSSVRSAAESLRGEFEVRLAPLRPSGQVDLDALSALITAETGLVSVAAANHEIGAMQPLTQIAALARAHGALVHSDLAQAAGKIPLDLADVHLASVSAHKLYGPLGIGALIVRRSVRRLLRPLQHGGGQEGGLRPGTLPAPLCIAFGVACRIASRQLPTEAERMRALRNRLLGGLRAHTEVEVNGALSDRLPGNLNLRFRGVDAEALVMRLSSDVIVATGSACNAHALEPSPVLLALGLTREEAESSIRIGLGRFTTTDEIDRAIMLIGAATTELRAVRRSPRA